MSDLLNQLTKAQLYTYQGLIREYKNNEVKDIGWYLHIKNTMIDMGVDANLAHKLAEARKNYE